MRKNLLIENGLRMAKFQKQIFQTIFHHHFQARNAKSSPIFHWVKNDCICHILCVNLVNLICMTLMQKCEGHKKYQGIQSHTSSLPQPMSMMFCTIRLQSSPTTRSDAATLPVPAEPDVGAFPVSIGVSLLSDFFSGSADFSFFASTLLSEVLALTGAPGVEGAALAPAENL